MQQVPGNPVKNRTFFSLRPKPNEEIADFSKKHTPRQYKALVVLAAVMVTTYLTANIMAVKLIEVFSLTLFDAGTITFPISYMLGDVITEIYGFKTARKLIFLTFFCNLLLVGATTIGIFLPYPDYMAQTQTAYATVFTQVPRILAASLIAFLAGEISNSFVMEKIKRITGKKHLWMRTIGSSAVGYFFDTVLFVLLAFSFTGPSAWDLFTMIAAQYLAKLAIESLGGTPLAYGVIHWINKGSEDSRKSHEKPAKEEPKDE
ncbi:MAG: queuosine precursor transporter [Oscillospiraceae bacterium]|jgi:uncharacterized integral membrane protein (TIGR00697 family)|nr:queuosine precursor transporter [Oscillospiraceae bacterium]